MSSSGKHRNGKSKLIDGLIHQCLPMTLFCMGPAKDTLVFIFVVALRKRCFLYL